MFASARKAASLIFDPVFRGLVLRAILLTLLLFLAGLVAVEYAISLLPVLGNPMANRVLALLAPILFVFALGALGGPVTALFGSLFLDRLAAGIEARDYPQATPAAGATFPITLKAGLRLTLWVLGADLALLPLDISLPGIGELVSLLVNGGLLGREYFELVALRHVSLEQSDQLRRRHAGAILSAGILISLLSVIPVADLIAPLFGVGLMVHLFHQIPQGAP